MKDYKLPFARRQMPAVAPKIRAKHTRRHQTHATIHQFQSGKRRRAFMYYVYLLRSKTQPDQTYVSSTGDLRKRLSEHDAGKSIHTNKFKPWNLMAYVALPEQHLAEELEKYLKSGSGRAFAKRHLLAQNGRKS
jgi:putative endonuclease